MEKYSIKINYIHMDENFIVIGWSAKDIGFGELTIYRITDIKEKESFVFDTECMSDSFRDAVLKEAFIYMISNISKD